MHECTIRSGGAENARREWKTREWNVLDTLASAGESCALRVADLHANRTAGMKSSFLLSGLPCAYTHGDARFLLMTLCTHDVC